MSKFKIVDRIIGINSSDGKTIHNLIVREKFDKNQGFKGHSEDNLCWFVVENEIRPLRTLNIKELYEELKKPYENILL